MTFIPLAIWVGHPQITVGFYIWKSLIPTLIGNLLGGGIFVGAAYWYLYLTGEDDVEVDFNVGATSTAIAEAGGPLGRAKSRPSHVVIEGQNPERSGPSGELPHSGAMMTSGIGRELSEEKYGRKSKGQTEGSDETKV